MCTAIGFPYKEGIVFGKTLEVAMKLDNKIMYVPKNTKNFIDSSQGHFSSKYATIGSAFNDKISFGDGINERGLMASSSLFYKYASFSKEIVEGKINMTTSAAFDYLLSRCKDIEEVRKEAKNIIISEYGNKGDLSKSNHFFFMDSKGDRVVLEPKDGVLVAYDNPYGVFANAPDFGWHENNLRNHINLESQDMDQEKLKKATLLKLGQTTKKIGLPGDFTSPSRFIRAAYFVSNTPKNLLRNSAILQTFRILSQFDIPKATIKDSIKHHQDETLYSSVIDSKERAYYIKCQENINIQSFYLEDYRDQKDITFIFLKKDMKL